MSIFRQACTINADGTEYTNAEAALLSMNIELGLGGGHDQVLIHCSHLSPLRDLQPDGTCAILLGPEDEEIDVFSGIITRVGQQLTGVVIEALAGTYPLSCHYGAQAYQEQTVGDIISDLAGQAEVSTGPIDGPLAVQIWHITEQRSAWWHINKLADMGGYEVLCDETGALVVRPVGSGGLSHSLRYGAEILSLEAGNQKDPGVRYPYAPAGAGSELGSDKWQVVLREPVGDSPEGPAAIIGALRDKNTADEMADGVSATITRSLFSGQALIIGNAAIRPGDTVDITDLPEQDTVSARVREVRHYFDNTNGFSTMLQLGGTP